jgi:hypothetical protein
MSFAIIIFPNQPLLYGEAMNTATYMNKDDRTLMEIDLFEEQLLDY